MPKLAPIPSDGNGPAYEQWLAGFFRHYGWTVKARPAFGDREADLLVSRGDSRYAVELKVSPEGRGDRLIPLLSQAILQAQAIVRRDPESATALAVVIAPLISPKLAAQTKCFLAENAPDVAVGLLDHEGFRFFTGSGLEMLNANPLPRPRRRQLALPNSTSLFSDLNQWMLKILLAPLVPEGLLHTPRGEYGNVSQLASAAGVSVMSAFRFVRQMRQEGFLDESDGILRVVRREELMSRWKAVYLHPSPEIPLRWIVPGKESAQRLAESLHVYAGHQGKKKETGPPACLGLFAAAEHLGFGFVRGIPPSFYMEKLDREALSQLGLSPEFGGRVPDVYVRVSTFRKSVFRAAVLWKGVPTTDILQVWLDVAEHPSRGAAQAEEIRSRALRSIFRE